MSQTSAALPDLAPPRADGSLLQRPPPRSRKNRHRASIMMSKDGFNRGTNSKLIEEKLGEQFRYFRKEFLDAALSIGVPVPLDMVEDKAGRVYTFVHQKGPRYLFQIMHGNPDSAHLLRCSLSLLIVTISILRGKLPESTAVSGMDRSTHQWLNMLTENVSSWALDSLTSIADGSAVAICTNLLRHSHSQTIQELILNLLAQLVNITEEAANQMLLYPTITSSDTPQKPQDTKDDDTGRIDSPVPRTPKSLGGAGVSENSTGSCSAKGGGGGGGGDEDENYTCLSYMFTVVAHHRNRYTVMTACAEVVLALVANKSSLICEEIARTKVSPGILESDDIYHRSSMKVSAMERASAASAARVKKKKAPTHSSDWAALKLMLKFLQRFMRYAVAGLQASSNAATAREETNGFSESSSLNPRALHQKQQKRGVCADIAAVPQKHKHSLATAHARVLLAVCELVNHSPSVASYVLTMPGARAIMKASCLLHKDSADIRSSVIQCMHILQRESERVYKEVSANRHSVSYELTHGRASKLFNPTAVLARGNTVKTPDRVGTPGRATSPIRASSPVVCPQQAQAPPMNPFTSEFLLPGEEGPNHVDIMVLQYDDTADSEEKPAVVFSSTSGSFGYGKASSFDSGISTHSRSASNVIYEDREEENDDDDWLRPDAKFVPARVPLLRKQDSKPLATTTRQRAGTTVRVDAQGMSKKQRLHLQSSSSFEEPNQEESDPAFSSTVPRQHSPTYNPPENPPRRGLKSNHSDAMGASLHRDLFSYLPEMPRIPSRLEATDIISGQAPNLSGVSTMEYLDSSMKHSLSISSSVVHQAYQSG